MPSTIIPPKDTDILFPQFYVLKASAGSGKTYALTKRYVQFILSEKVPFNSIQNIIAITFSNNAAKEMKERILAWLKGLYLGDKDKLEEMETALSIDREKIRNKSGLLMDYIILNYSDFKIKTIDSFMTSIFKSFAVDFNYSVDFEIVMNPDPAIAYAFDLFLKRVASGTHEASLIKDIIDSAIKNKGFESPYPWNPYDTLLEEIQGLYKKISSLKNNIKERDYSLDIAKIKEEIRDKMEEIERIKTASNLPVRGDGYNKVLGYIRDNRYVDLIKKIVDNPVLKPKDVDRKGYEAVMEGWGELKNLINHYTFYYGHNYYTPYAKGYNLINYILSDVKKREGIVFINDINKILSDYIEVHDKALIIPEIYFRLGEMPFHYLIDEFQDTSRLQWGNLHPIIEESLSKGGTLFVVGDTKQAIYGFRDADYTIMKMAESTNLFPCANHMVHELNTNYRSMENIVDFNNRLFKETLPSNEQYRFTGEQSGLINFTQNVEHGHEGTGYVEAVLVERDGEDPIESVKLIETILNIQGKGYRLSDIAILTTKNSDVTEIAGWLNEKKIDFISYSSLDIRKRKITLEVISLLRFLDSPLDDLSFASFILSGIFSTALKNDGIAIDEKMLHEFFTEKRGEKPFYKAFQRKFKTLWESYFDKPFKLIGYLPSYDLVSELFKRFKLFENFPNEEGAIAKILEIIKNLEDKNSIKDFLNFAELEEENISEWDMDVPEGTDAVKVMTIHKAKGLGFPVVILVLYGENNSGFDYIVNEEEEEPSLLKINSDMAEADKLFTRLYAKAKRDKDVDRLNTLYVGLTRAELEMYILGVKRGKKSASYHPFDLIKEERLCPLHEDILNRDHDTRFNEISITHSAKPLKITSFTYSEPLHSIHIKEQIFGEFIHSVLSMIEYEDTLTASIGYFIDKANARMKTAYNKETTEDLITRFINREDLKGYFMKIPGRVIKNEQGFISAEGRLFRMDRLIIDRDTVTVIDYKTGAENIEEDKDQIDKYVAILKDIYKDKLVDGVIKYLG